MNRKWVEIDSGEVVLYDEKGREIMRLDGLDELATIKRYREDLGAPEMNPVFSSGGDKLTLSVKFKQLWEYE